MWPLLSRPLAALGSALHASSTSTASSLSSLSSMFLAQRLQRPISGLARATTVVQPRLFAAASMATDAGSSEGRTQPLNKIRNIGISAHIDSGKTTLTERILFYTGRIRDIHEVKGKDGVGAKMDSMDLEREKGITIQSAATYCGWKDHHINIIDTPGHVDFTIEVERALRVLDGAVLVLCAVSGVQSQTLTVNRQMIRYNVPRVAFINKLDRQGSNPFRVIEQLRSKLKINCSAVQLPIGLEDNLAGLVDLVHERGVTFEGEKGERIIYGPIPEEMQATAKQKRLELIERIADVDEEIAEKFLADEIPTAEELAAGIRRATIGLKFVPVFMGSAYKNKGVQEMLDGVCSYLPNPSEKKNEGLDYNNNEAVVAMDSVNPKLPTVALAFKLEESRFGQLTYMRVYQGALNRGEFITNTSNERKVKIPRLVRMHANDMEDVSSVSAGEICAMFGVECATGDTFTDGSVRYGMQSMFVPDPVMSLSITPKKKEVSANFAKALSRFSREDPTFRVRVDAESGQTIISGMGELHLEIYVERMKREYACEVVTGRPYVAYRETIQQRADFDYTHKKQSGGAGQYGKIIGYIEPLPLTAPQPFEFVNKLIGNNVPPQYVPACEKGFRDAVGKGSLIGHMVSGVRVVITDGATHPVDSSEMAFKIACQNAFRQAFENASPSILEPVMKVEVQVPSEFQGSVIGTLNQRKGMIANTDSRDDYTSIEAEVPLNNMFGFSTELRSLTQGKGEFTMEYKEHQIVPRTVQAELEKEYERKRLAANK